MIGDVGEYFVVCEGCGLGFEDLCVRLLADSTGKVGLRGLLTFIMKRVLTLGEEEGGNMMWV